MLVVCVIGVEAHCGSNLRNAISPRTNYGGTSASPSRSHPVAMIRESNSELGMPEQTDLVELRTRHSTTFCISDISRTCHCVNFTWQSALISVCVKCFFNATDIDFGRNACH